MLISKGSIKESRLIVLLILFSFLRESPVHASASEQCGEYFVRAQYAEELRQVRSKEGGIETLKDLLRMFREGDGKSSSEQMPHIMSGLEALGMSVGSFVYVVTRIKESTGQKRVQVDEREILERQNAEAVEAISREEVRQRKIKDVISRYSGDGNWRSNFDGATIMHEAVRKNAIDDVRTIHSFYPDLINQSDWSGRTVLCEAALLANKDMIQVIYELSPSLIRAKDHNDNTVLHHVSRQASKDIKYFSLVALVYKLSPDMANAKNNSGDTVLHAAVKESRYALVKLLIDLGASPFVLDGQNKRPIDVATDPKIIWMLEHYAMVEPTEEVRSEVELQDAIAKYGDGNWRDRDDGRTALHEAAKVGDSESIRILSKAFPDLVKIKDKNRHTPLHTAAVYDHPGVIKVLLEILPEYMNDYTWLGQTALGLAVTNYSIESVRELIKSGANPYISTRGTPYVRENRVSLIDRTENDQIKMMLIDYMNAYKPNYFEEKL